MVHRAFEPDGGPESARPQALLKISSLTSGSHHSLPVDLIKSEWTELLINAFADHFHCSHFDKTGRKVF